MSEYGDLNHRKLASLALIPLFMGIIGILFVLDIQTVSEPPYLLLVLNSVFLGLIPLYISYLTIRTYLSRGQRGVLLIGTGMLVMGLGAVIAGSAIALPNGPNITVTIHNTSFLVGAVLAFAAALANIFHPSWMDTKGRAGIATLFYAGACLFVFSYTIATLLGAVPPFFIQGIGPTMLRQAVLTSATVLFAAASAVLYLTRARKQEDFFFWLSLSLGLIAIGLFSVGLEPAVGDPVSWMGRISQYIGACFALVAFLGARKTASMKGVPVQEMIARFFGEAEAGYRALVEASTSAIVVLDPSDRIIVWNPAAERMFGYTKNEAVGSPVAMIGTDPLMISYIQARAAGTGIGDNKAGEDHIEATARKKEGGTFPIDISVFGYWVDYTWARTCIIRDVTERKKAEEDLRRKQAEIRVLIENIPAGLVLFDATPPYTVLIHNQYYQELFAEPYRSEGMVGLNVYEYAPEAEASGVVATIEEIVRTRQPKSFIDFPYTSHPREESWYNWYLAPIIIGEQVVALVSMSLDVTDRHKADEALQETSQYLENLITSANAPIIVWDIEFRITRFNRAFERLTGRPTGEVMGQKLDILFPEATRAQSLEQIRGTSSGQHWEAVEIPILHRDGSIRTVLWNSATLFDPGTGLMTATIAQGQDITDRKLSEDKLRETAENLRRSNEDLERFAYVASHDLREPLRMVTSFSQLLAQKYKGRLDPDADEFISYIVDGGRKMDALVNDLLEFSRITSRGKPFQPTDMNVVLGEVLKSLSVMVRENHAKIETGILPTVPVDRGQLSLVFQNLITNAIKFHDDRDPVISVNAVRGDHEWVFSVRDNGIGVDPAYHEKIFEIFQRLHSREQYPGTGIGLAICKRVIDRHGGRIWVESEMGKGSTFFFTIPVKPMKLGM